MFNIDLYGNCSAVSIKGGLLYIYGVVLLAVLYSNSLYFYLLYCISCVSNN